MTGTYILSILFQMKQSGLKQDMSGWLSSQSDAPELHLEHVFIFNNSYSF